MQAVLLAGGRGTRLAPLTDSTPKVLVRVAGRPFLSHLAKALSQQGVSRLLILAGYKAEQLITAAAAVPEGAMDMTVAIGDLNWSTGERLIHARAELEEQFLLLYSDNLAAFNLNRLRGHFDSGKFDVVLSVATKSPGNVSFVDEEPGQCRYWAGRRWPDASRTELGFALISRDVLLDELMRTDQDFPYALQNLSHRGRVGADQLHGPYLSISEVPRLELTEKVLRRQKVMFLDRDGILNERPSQGTYITAPEQLRIIPRNAEALATLARQGIRLIVISNQAGVGRGVMTMEQVDAVNDALQERLSKYGVTLERIYTCPHGWDEGCVCRKPQPGMLHTAADDLGIFLPRVIFVGDDVRDVEAGNAAGAQTIYISEASSPEFRQSPSRPTLGTFADLGEASDDIQCHFGEHAL